MKAYAFVRRKPLLTRGHFMQQLVKRNTYTPTNVPQVCGFCGLSLKVPRGKDGVADLKTFSNNLDAALTGLVVPGRIINLRKNYHFYH